MPAHKSPSKTEPRPLDPILPGLCPLLDGVVEVALVVFIVLRVVHITSWSSSSSSSSSFFSLTLLYCCVIPIWAYFWLAHLLKRATVCGATLENQLQYLLPVLCLLSLFSLSFLFSSIICLLLRLHCIAVVHLCLYIFDIVCLCVRERYSKFWWGPSKWFLRREKEIDEGNKY